MNQEDPQSPKGLLAMAGNWIGLLGLAVTACSLLVLLCLIAFDLFLGFDRPYVGVIIYIILPGLVLAGLLLTAIGIWRQRRLRKIGVPPPPLPHLDLNNPRHRRNLLLTAGIIFVFLLFSAFGSYRAYQVTESVAFCGLLCHGVMEPVHTAYLNSPHARVACTKCHIGPGASWYVRAKISGLRQVYAVLTNSFPRPIPVPVENLRPARETCEQCHWPEKFYGATELLRRHYRSDPDNTPFEIRMLLKVGGANPRHGPIGGIHWHMVVGNDIEYLPADRSRQNIPWIRATNRETGKTTVYRSPDSPSASQPPAAEIRRMDCIDCHNRPTHIFQSPNEALDVALWLERIDDSVPSIKLNTARALVQSAEAASQSDGLRKIADLLSMGYADYSDQAKIAQAIEEARNIFRNNFFPEMKTDWRVRPDNIGHFIWTGCFRCHDGSHVSETGETITSDCNACHAIVAQGKPGETDTVNLAGLDFDHPGGMIPPGINCNLCHSGSP